MAIPATNATVRHLNYTILPSMQQYELGHNYLVIHCFKVVVSFQLSDSDQILIKVLSSIVKSYTTHLLRVTQQALMERQLLIIHLRMQELGQFLETSTQLTGSPSMRHSQNLKLLVRLKVSRKHQLALQIVGCKTL